MKIVHPDINQKIDLKELRQFICDGKRNGFASGKKPIKSSDCREEYSYSNEKFFYLDQYKGSGSFIGQETVFYLNKNNENVPLWGMNYFDTFNAPKGFSSDQTRELRKNVLTFLKLNLMNIPLEYPFRGPIGEANDYIKDRKLVYSNQTDCLFKGEKAFTNFRGEEKISLAERKDSFNIFSLIYHGGLLIPNRYIKG